MSEVDAELLLEHAVNGIDSLGTARGAIELAARRAKLAISPGAGFDTSLGVSDDGTRHVLRRHHAMGDARIACRLGHAPELRAVGVLHEDHAARFVDVSHAA